MRSLTPEGKKNKLSAKAMQQSQRNILEGIVGIPFFIRLPQALSDASTDAANRIWSAFDAAQLSSIAVLAQGVST